MLKKLLISLASLAMVAQPIMPSAVLADSGAWSYVQATGAWSYENYKVERLSFDANTMGPLTIGNSVMIAKPAATCEPNGCARYDLYLLKDGMQMFVGNVPLEAINEQRYFNNENDFVYIDASNLENTRWNVVSTDLENGQETNYLDDMFMDGVQDVDVMYRDGKFYFDPSLNWNDHKGYTNATIYVYNPETDQAEVVPNNWQQNRDELQDVQDGLILSKMVFTSGNKQLWTYDTSTYPATAEAVPNTWTPETENIVGAHFRADGSIEFFSMFQRYIYNGETTVAQGDYLSWNKSYEESLQVVDGRMAWLDPQNILRVSGTDVNLNLGIIGDAETFRLTPEAIYFPTANGGKEYNFASKTYIEYPFNVTDSQDNILVGQDATGRLWYMNTETNRLTEIGFGTGAVLSDEMHVYWRGADGYVYEATMSLNAMSEAETISAIKVSGSPKVYLTLDDKSYWITDEKVYFSWFESWDDVRTVSTNQFNNYDYSGAAAYAPGTRLKLANDPKVYMVGVDGKLHWITTQLLAYNIYGPTWNKGIIEFNNQDMTGLLFSSPITSESDVQSI
ncbi:MAG: hypothetical protein V1664_04130 [Candidatus Uhrbacteria bacterium]